MQNDRDQENRRAHQKDINLPNEPFPLFGRMLPAYRDGQWSYTVERWGANAVKEICFPDESCDFAAMSEEGSVFLGAYDGETCVGLAILQPGFFKYMYLYDLKVSGAYRGQGVGQRLIERAKEIAAQQNYRGLYTQGQDNNPGACLFYLKSGFRIGGLDTDLYRHTAQDGKADIIFYIDC